MTPIGLVGFGKVGQAVAAQVLDLGHTVTVVDIDAELKMILESGAFTSYEPGVLPAITDGFNAGRLSIHTEVSALRNSTAVIVCIPLLVHDAKNGRGSIDYEPFNQCFQSIATVVHDNMLVVLETTVPVGTCRNRLVPIFSACNKVHERDYLLAFSPERVMSNTMREQLVSLPKIVAGLTDQALAAVLDLYRSFLPPDLVEPVSSIETAEMIKLTAMVARDVNIALINQLSLFCDANKLDIREVIKNTNTDRVSNVLSPGIGVGGHCTPVYPHFLISNFSESKLEFRLAQEARKINDAMPEYVVASVCREFSLQSALIMGLGFRPDVKEDAYSPAYSLRRLLTERGVEVFIHDPLYSEEELTSKGFVAAGNVYGRKFDAIFLVTAHSQYATLNFPRIASLGCKIFVDGRNAFDEAVLRTCGIAYRGIGTGCLSPAEVKSQPKVVCPDSKVS